MRRGTLKVGKYPRLIDVQFGKRSQRDYRHDRKCHPGRNSLNRQRRVDRAGRQSGDGRDFDGVVNEAKFRIALRHLAEQLALAIGEMNRDFSHLQVEHDIAALPRPREHKGGAEGRMAGEGEFVSDREDAHADSALALDGDVAREHERRLGEIHFARQRLHFGVAQAGRVGEDRQPVARKRAGSENVNGDERIALHRRNSIGAASAIPCAARSVTRSALEDFRAPCHNRCSARAAACDGVEQ